MVARAHVSQSHSHHFFQKQVIRGCLCEASEHVSTQKLCYSSFAQDLSIQTVYQDSDLTDDRISVVRLLQKFGESTSTIFDALLTEKRVLFIADPSTTPAYDLCCFVLAACALVSPPLPLLQRRVFPYSPLAHHDAVNVRGYIGGFSKCQQRCGASLF